MSRQILLGDEAVALGALHAGDRLVTEEHDPVRCLHAAPTVPRSAGGYRIPKPLRVGPSVLARPVGPGGPPPTSGLTALARGRTLG